MLLLVALIAIDHTLIVLTGNNFYIVPLCPLLLPCLFDILYIFDNLCHLIKVSARAIVSITGLAVLEFVYFFSDDLTHGASLWLIFINRCIAHIFFWVFLRRSHKIRGLWVITEGFNGLNKGLHNFLVRRNAHIIGSFYIMCSRSLNLKLNRVY